MMVLSQLDKKANGTQVATEVHANCELIPVLSGPSKGEKGSI